MAVVRQRLFFSFVVEGKQVDTRTLEAVVLCLGQVFFLAGPQKGFRHVLKRDSKRMLRAMAEPLLDQLLDDIHRDGDHAGQTAGKDLVTALRGSDWQGAWTALDRMDALEIGHIPDDEPQERTGWKVRKPKHQ